MIHGYDHIASVLLQAVLGSMIRRELRAFTDAALMSIAFNRTTDRAAEFWIVIPKDPMSVRLGSFTYRGET